MRQYLCGDEPDVQSVVNNNDAALAKAVCAELLVRVSTAPKALNALKDTASVLVTAAADDRAIQVRDVFNQLNFTII